MKMERTKGFVYNVINRLCENDLSTEIHLLNTGDLTWRELTGKALFINKITEYETSYIATYKHFCKEFPEYLEKFKEHDALLESAEEAARKLAKNLATSEKLTNFQHETIKKNKGMVDAKILTKTFFIEFVINSNENLQGLLHPMRKVLLLYKDIFAQSELLKAIDHEDKYDLEVCKYKLSVNSQELKKNLEDLSFDLCKKYEIAADPLNRCRRCNNEMRCHRCD